MDIAELGLSIRSDGVVVATDKLKKFRGEANKTDTAADKLTAATNRLAIAFGTTLVSAVGVAGLRAFASYEQGLKNVASVSGATAAELVKLDGAALRAAASTRFDPTQTTSALYSLASAGQSAAEQISTLPNVLNLAEAAQSNLGQTTELLTSTLSQFNLNASDSTRVADVFTASIGASALNVNRLQVAFRNAGPTASALNQSLEGTTAALGILTTSFGNGERAGTGFRAILNELPDKAAALRVNLYDATGAMRPFAEILGEIEDRGLTASGAVQMFGAEAGPSLAALLTQGSGALAEMEGKLTSTGQAAEVAANQLDTLQGDFDGLSSAISVALVEIGRSEQGFARPAIQTVTNLIRLWSGYGDTLGEAREQTELYASIIQRAGTYTVTAAAGVVIYKGAAIAAQVATMGWATALGVLRAALIRTGIGALIVGAGELVYQFSQLVEKTGGVGAAFSEMGSIGTQVISRVGDAAYGLQIIFHGVGKHISASMLEAFEDTKQGMTGLVDHAARARIGATRSAGDGFIDRGAGEISYAMRPLEVSGGIESAGGGPAWGEMAEFLGSGALEAANDNISGIASAFTAANDNATALTDTLGSIGPATLDPFALLKQNLGELDAQLSAGKITWEQYGEAAYRANMNAVSGTLSLASGLTGALSQMFEDNKAFAIANAVVNTAQAVTATLAQYGGTPWGFAAAGVAAVSGAAQIASIVSADKGSSSVASVGGAQANVPTSAAGETSQRTTNLTIVGNGFSDEQLVEAMNAALGDGHKLNVFRKAS